VIGEVWSYGMFLNELLTLERPKLTPGHGLQPPTNVERALLVHFPPEPTLMTSLDQFSLSVADVVVLSIHTS